MQGLKQTFQTMFYGSDEERIYHPLGDDMGIIVDSGNLMISAQKGISYGMMMCMKPIRKEEFDRLWKWAKTYMYHDDEQRKRILCLVTASWTVLAIQKVQLQMGKSNTQWPSFRLPIDGVTEKEFSAIPRSRTILRDCIHKGEKPGTGHPM